MMDGAPRALFPVLYWVGVGCVLAWNLVVAGQASRVRRAPSWLAGLTALAGFLAPPALLVAVAAPSTLDGRTLHVIGWLWPLVAVLVAVQVIGTVLVRQSPLHLAVPLALYSLLVAALAVTRLLVGEGADPGALLTALLAAERAALTPLLGARALDSSVALLVPVLAPLFPARTLAGSVARPTIAVAAAAWVALVGVVAFPRAMRAVGGFDAFAQEPAGNRSDPALLLGLQVLGPLRGPPASLAIRNDLTLLDSLDADVALVEVRPSGTSVAALDSLSRVLTHFRTDTVPGRLAVLLGFERGDAERARLAPDSLRAARVAMAGRVVRTLRPDVLLPAPSPRDADRQASGPLPDDWLRTYVRAVADEAHRLRPRTRVGVLVSAFDARDSALYDWAASAGSPVDLLAFALFPTLDGAAGLEARLTTAGRWLESVGRQRAHWVVTGGYPYAFGEASQRLTIRRVRAWAAARSAVEACIVSGAADYDRLTGLRVAGGRLRPAVDELARRE